MNITPQAADAFARAWDETRDGPRENELASPDYRALLEMAVEALAVAQEALESCYNVTGWPANGGTTQDDAIRAIHATLTTIKTALEGK